MPVNKNKLTAVSKRIDAAIKHLSENDLENALIQICVAIDRTAKKKFPKKKGVGDRIKLFLEEYESLIYQFASNGMLIMERGAVIQINGLLPDTIYKLIRCALLHGDDLEDKIKLIEGSYRLGIEDGKILINAGHIDGLLFSVISDVVNTQEYCNGVPEFFFHDTIVLINDLWGDLQKIEDFTGYKKEPSQHFKQ